MTTIAARLYHDGKVAQEIDLSKPIPHITQPNDFIWMGLHEPDDGALKRVQDHFGVPRAHLVGLSMGGLYGYISSKDQLAARAELALGDAAKFFPTDAALASWMAQADQGQAQIVYD